MNKRQAKKKKAKVVINGQEYTGDVIEISANVDENIFDNPLDRQYASDLKDLANNVIEIDTLRVQSVENDIDDVIEQGDNLANVMKKVVEYTPTAEVITGGLTIKNITDDTINNIIEDTAENVKTDAEYIKSHPVKYMASQLLNTWKETVNEINEARNDIDNQRETLGEKFANGWAAMTVDAEYLKDSVRAAYCQNLNSATAVYSNAVDKYSEFAKNAKASLNTMHRKMDNLLDKMLDTVTLGAYSKTACYLEKYAYEHADKLEKEVYKFNIKKPISSLLDTVQYKLNTNLLASCEKKYGKAENVDEMKQNIDAYYKNLTDNAFFWGNMDKTIKDAPQYNGEVADVTFLADYKNSPVEATMALLEKGKNFFGKEFNKASANIKEFSNYLDIKADIALQSIKDASQQFEDKFNEVQDNIKQKNSIKDYEKYVYKNTKEYIKSLDDIIDDKTRFTGDRDKALQDKREFLQNKIKSMYLKIDLRKDNINELLADGKKYNVKHLEYYTKQDLKTIDKLYDLLDKDNKSYKKENLQLAIDLEKEYAGSIINISSNIKLGVDIANRSNNLTFEQKHTAYINALIKERDAAYRTANQIESGEIKGTHLGSTENTKTAQFMYDKAQKSANRYADTLDVLIKVTEKTYKAEEKFVDFLDNRKNDLVSAYGTAKKGFADFGKKSVNLFKSAKDYMVKQTKLAYTVSKWNEASIIMNGYKNKVDNLQNQINSYTKCAKRIEQTKDGLIQKESVLQNTQNEISTLVGKLAGTISCKTQITEPSKQLLKAMDILNKSITLNDVTVAKMQLDEIKKAYKTFSETLRGINYEKDIKNNPLLTADELEIAEQIKEKVDNFIIDKSQNIKDLTECDSKLNIISDKINDLSKDRQLNQNRFVQAKEEVEVLKQEAIDLGYKDKADDDSAPIIE